MINHDISKLHDFLRCQFDDETHIYSYNFFGRIVEAVNDGAGYALELAKDSGGKNVWWCWRLWEKQPDRDSIKWIVYAPPTVERNYPE